MDRIVGVEGETHASRAQDDAPGSPSADSQRGHDRGPLPMMLTSIPLLMVVATVEPGGAAGDAARTADRPARVLFERAEAKFDLGSFEAALADYQAAYELEPLPGFLFNIGQCYRNLGDYERARFFYRRFLIARSPHAQSPRDGKADCGDVETARRTKGWVQRAERRSPGRVSSAAGAAAPDRPAPAPVDSAPAVQRPRAGPTDQPNSRAFTAVPGFGSVWAERLRREWPRASCSRATIPGAALPSIDAR